MRASHERYRYDRSLARLPCLPARRGSLPASLAALLSAGLGQRWREAAVAEHLEPKRARGGIRFHKAHVDLVAESEAFARALSYKGVRILDMPVEVAPKRRGRHEPVRARIVQFHEQTEARYPGYAGLESLSRRAPPGALQSVFRPSRVRPTWLCVRFER